MFQSDAMENDVCWKNIKFDSWEEFRNYIVSWRENHDIMDKYVFRGHADSTWLLEPTIDRIKPKMPPGTKKVFASWYQSIEKVLTEEYQRAAQLFSNQSIGGALLKATSVLDWLAIMQHHGAATRLLDVTFSPIIASFFACSDVWKWEAEKEIWAFPLSIFNIVNSGENNQIIPKPQDAYAHYQSFDMSKTDEDMIGYTCSKILTDRQFHQQGAFLFSMSKTKSLLELLGKYFDNESSKLIRMSFTFTNRDDFTHAVNDIGKMGVTYSSLFPDIDGYSKEVFIKQFLAST